MTGSLHWVTGGTRPDESFATTQLQRKQAASLVSDHKRAVQTVKGQPEIGLRFGPLSTQMCVVVYTDSALHNADADTDDEGSDDGWLARARQKGICVRSQHGALVCVVNQDDLEKTEAIPMSFMTWKSTASKRTILSTFGAEASACRDALDQTEYTRAVLCEVPNGARVLPDERTEEHLPIRVITDCKCLFDCLAKNVSVPEDRGMALTVASLRERCSPVNFSHPQRGLLSEITSESAQALEAQRHSLVQEAAAETLRSDTRNQESVSQ